MSRARKGIDPQLAADHRALRGAAAVCSFVFDIRPEAFFRASRGRAGESEVRQIMLAVAKRAIEDRGEVISAERLAKAIGRDRSTVSDAIHKIETACEGDSRVDLFIEEMADIVRPLVKVQAIVSGAIDDGVKAVRADDPGEDADAA